MLRCSGGRPDIPTDPVFQWPLPAASVIIPRRTWESKRQSRSSPRRVFHHPQVLRTWGCHPV